LLPTLWIYALPHAPYMWQTPGTSMIMLCRCYAAGVHGAAGEGVEQQALSLHMGQLSPPVLRGVPPWATHPVAHPPASSALLLLWLKYHDNCKCGILVRSPFGAPPCLIRSAALLAAGRPWAEIAHVLYSPRPSRGGIGRGGRANKAGARSAYPNSNKGGFLCSLLPGGR